MALEKISNLQYIAQIMKKYYLYFAISIGIFILPQFSFASNLNGLSIGSSTNPNNGNSPYTSADFALDPNPKSTGNASLKINNTTEWDNATSSNIFTNISNFNALVIWYDPNFVSTSTFVSSTSIMPWHYTQLDSFSSGICLNNTCSNSTLGINAPTLSGRYWYTVIYSGIGQNTNDCLITGTGGFNACVSEANNNGLKIGDIDFFGGITPTFNITLPVASSTINYDFSSWSGNIDPTKINSSDSYDIKIDSSAPTRNFVSSDEFSGIAGTNLLNTNYSNGINFSSQNILGNIFWNFSKNDTWLPRFSSTVLGSNTSTQIFFHGIITDQTTGAFTDIGTSSITFAPNGQTTYPTSFPNSTSSVYGSFSSTTLFNASTSSGGVNCTFSGLFSSSTLSDIQCYTQQAVVSIVGFLFTPSVQSVQTIQNQFQALKNTIPFSIAIGDTGIITAVQNAISTSTATEKNNLNLIYPGTYSQATTTFQILSSSTLAATFGSAGQTTILLWEGYTLYTMLIVAIGAEILIFIKIFKGSGVKK